MKIFHRAIFFTKIPLVGHYKFKDIFQIFPYDLKNIQTEIFYKHYPNILEFWSTDEEITITPNLDDIFELSNEFEYEKLFFNSIPISLSKQDKILALLTTFTNNHFFRYSDIEGFWGIPNFREIKNEVPDSWTSKWCEKMYLTPEVQKQFKIEEFTIHGYNEINKIKQKEYFLNDPNIDFDSNKEIILPDTIDQLFENYYSLDPKTAFIINAATQYINNAIEFKDSRKTLSLLVSFIAMETMVNLEYKDEKSIPCPKCTQEIYSVCRKFREYLLKYLGDTAYNKKKFNKYYNLRSKIVHTGRQLETESLFSEVPDSIKDNEFLTRIEIIQISKLAIINWLLYPRT